MQVINMLTGMIKATFGDALVFGKSILTDMRSIRRDLGMCPQHNILWDNLTVTEHMYAFGRLRGIKPFKHLEARVTTLIKEVDIIIICVLKMKTEKLLHS